MERAKRLATMTEEEYLAFERSSTEKHEYVNGEVYAMAGGTLSHSRMAANVIASLVVALREKPCGVFTSDARVRVVATKKYTYPDVTVICGDVVRDPIDETVAVNPVVLVEILSDATETEDRGSKFAHYRLIPTLREYVLISHRDKRIEVFRKNDKGRFELFEFVGEGAIAEFESIGCVLPIDEVYAKVEWSADGVAL